MCVQIIYYIQSGYLTVIKLKPVPNLPTQKILGYFFYLVYVIKQ